MSDGSNFDAYLTIGGERIALNSVDIELSTDTLTEAGRFEMQECDECGEPIPPTEKRLVVSTRPGRSGVFHNNCGPE